ncbi:GspE/PulE family protein [Pseudomonas aeruginosa]|uniref:GspE/PulE family protein n=1 Tax=Pseudomonas aeruginosa TaxID=287 RepID=UPI00062CA3B4|nr:GspE/PulE family protein [Pseudomonas aeruginosa]
MSVFATAAQDRLLDLGDLLRELVAQGRVGQEQAEQCLAIRRSAVRNQQHPLEFLAAQQVEDLKRPGRKLDLETLTQWLAEYAGQPYLRIDPLKIDVAAVTPLMSYAFAQRHGILAVALSPEEVTIASAQPFVQGWESNLVHVLKRPIKRVVANPADIQRYTVEFFRLARSVSGATSPDQKISGVGNFEQLLNLGAADQEPDANDAHIVTIVDWLFQYAFQQRASDIHIEPRREQGTVRFRIDGVLHNVYQFPPQVTMAVVSRLKSLGRMNVAEKRKPQDGRVKTKTPDGAEVELRLSTLPTAFGEKMVMRIFDPEVLLKSFDQLGFSADDLRRWQSMTSQPNGIILVTGPTGSGKTTTLYASLTTLNDRTRNILTVEDPIEYHLEGIGQTQVNAKVDMTFARGLRAILRQDPDVVMVGEIRDLETAEIAVQASLTGHLVLSTLHTNSAIGAITRLVDMGIEPFLLSSSMLGVLAQRLVRVLCPACKEPYRADEAECALLGVDPAAPPTLHRARGCGECHQHGYRGRTGIYELVVFDDHMRSLIHNESSEQEMTRHARTSGPSIRDDGRRKVLEGVTTVEEVLRVTREE